MSAGSQELQKPQEPEEPNLCRICADEGTEDEPLISPCKCRGSIRYVHNQCLKSWIGRRDVIGLGLEGFASSWNCEVCRADYVATWSGVRGLGLWARSFFTCGLAIVVRCFSSAITVGYLTSKLFDVGPTDRYTTRDQLFDADHIIPKIAWLAFISLILTVYSIILSKGRGLTEQTCMRFFSARLSVVLNVGLMHVSLSELSTSRGPKVPLPGIPPKFGPMGVACDICPKRYWKLEVQPPACLGHNSLEVQMKQPFENARGSLREEVFRGKIDMAGVQPINFTKVKGCRLTLQEMCAKTPMGAYVPGYHPPFEAIIGKDYSDEDEGEYFSDDELPEYVSATFKFKRLNGVFFRSREHDRLGEQPIYFSFSGEYMLYHRYNKAEDTWHWSSTSPERLDEVRKNDKERKEKALGRSIPDASYPTVVGRLRIDPYVVSGRLRSLSLKWLRAPMGIPKCMSWYQVISSHFVLVLILVVVLFFGPALFRSHVLETRTAIRLTFVHLGVLAISYVLQHHQGKYEPYIDLVVFRCMEKSMLLFSFFVLHKDDFCECVLIQCRINPGFAGDRQKASVFDFPYLGALQFICVACTNRAMLDTRNPHAACCLLVVLALWSFSNFKCNMLYNKKELGRDAGMAGLEFWLFAFCELQQTFQILLNEKMDDSFHWIRSFAIATHGVSMLAAFFNVARCEAMAQEWKSLKQAVFIQVYGSEEGAWRFVDHTEQDSDEPIRKVQSWQRVCDRFSHYRRPLAALLLIIILPITLAYVSYYVIAWPESSDTDLALAEAKKELQRLNKEALKLEAALKAAASKSKIDDDDAYAETSRNALKYCVVWLRNICFLVGPSCLVLLFSSSYGSWRQRGAARRLTVQRGSRRRHDTPPRRDSIPRAQEQEGVRLQPQEQATQTVVE